MGEQLDIFAPKPKPKRARKAAPPSPCAAAPRRPDGRLWAGADRRCTHAAGHDGAHENTAGDVWAPGEVLAPCCVCGGAHWTTDTPGFSRDAKPWLFATCTWCDERGHARSVCGACGEALPLCPCFRTMRREVTT